MNLTVSPVMLVAAFCVALTGVNLSFMVVAALLPTLSEAWSLSETEAGWLGGVFFAGYIGTVPVLSSLADRMDPKRIYLTSTLIGAAGSIGSELVRQALKFDPAEVLLVDQAELGLFNLMRGLEATEVIEASRLVPLIADVLDRQRLEHLRTEERDEVLIGDARLGLVDVALLVENADFLV